MKYIQLKHNLQAIVDDEDYEYINQWRWHSYNGYAVRAMRMKSSEYGKKDGKYVTVKMHRLIVNASKDKEVDHINGNPLDNRKTNLRLVTSQQNKWNQKTKTNNTSGFKGVSLFKDRFRSKPWRAYIVIDNKQKSLGVYESKLEAARAYNEGAKKYFGEFARFNNI